MEKGLEEDQRGYKWTTATMQVKMIAGGTKVILEIREDLSYLGGENQPNLCFWNMGDEGYQEEFIVSRTEMDIDAIY